MVHRGELTFCTSVSPLPSVHAYSFGDVARICRVPESRLRYWDRTALLQPSRQNGAPPAFDFRDLASVRSLVDLLSRGVPLSRIRRCVEALAERHPDVERPLGALELWESDSRRVVARHAEGLFEADGQRVLDFASGPVQADVAVLADRQTEPRGDGSKEPTTPLEWFEYGCTLDSDPSTYAEAIAAYRMALEADPAYADAHCNLGSLFFNQGRTGAARKCFERALELRPDHLEANLNLAACFEADGRDEAALRRYKLAIEAEPLHADARASLALFYERLGLPGRAREQWRRYLQLAPEGSFADVARKRVSD